MIYSVYKHLESLLARCFAKENYLSNVGITRCSLYGIAVRFSASTALDVVEIMLLASIYSMYTEVFLLKFFFLLLHFLQANYRWLFWSVAYFASLTCTSADSVCSSVKVCSLNNCMYSSAHMWQYSFGCISMHSLFVEARAHRCSDIVQYALFFHLPMSFETRAVRIAIATVGRKSAVTFIIYVVVGRAVRRSRSGLRCAGVTVPNQSQMRDCQSKSQHGPHISCLPSHDKCICCCLGIWITRAS